GERPGHLVHGRGEDRRAGGATARAEPGGPTAVAEDGGADRPHARVVRPRGGEERAHALGGDDENLPGGVAVEHLRGETEQRYGAGAAGAGHVVLVDARIEAVVLDQALGEARGAQ